MLDVLELIAAGRDLPAVLAAICRGVEAQRPDSGLCAAILLYGEATGRLHLAAAPSLPTGFRTLIDGMAAAPGTASCGTAAFQRCRVIVPDIASHPHWTAYREAALAHGLRACWSEPVFGADRRLLATLALYNHHPAHPTADDLSFLHQCATLAAIAIERHQREERLRESENRLALALAATNDGLWDWHLPSGRVLFNERWMTMLGFNPGELPGDVSTWEKLLHPQDRAMVADVLQAHLRGDTPLYECEHRLRSRSGEWIWVLDRGRVVEWDASGAPIRAIGTHTDITARKRAERALLLAKEEAEAGSRSKSTFLATMSHELRTPLNAIIGFAEAMELGYSGPLSEKQTDYIRSIRTAGEHLRDIISDVLDLSKIEAGKLELNLEPVCLPRALEAHVRLMTDTARLRGIDLRVDLPDSLPLVRADALRLRQIVLNLLSNALKFTPSGGSVRLGAMPVPDGVAIAVSDTGVGMTAAEIELALEPFRQVDMSPTRRHEGTGLGLTLCRALVEAHGSRLLVESRKGQGTTVSFALLADHPDGRYALAPVGELAAE